VTCFNISRKSDADLVNVTIETKKLLYPLFQWQPDIFQDHQKRISVDLICPFCDYLGKSISLFEVRIFIRSHLIHLLPYASRGHVPQLSSNRTTYPSFRQGIL
jgi:hypothetical protein